MRDIPVISVRIISKAGFLPITKNRFTPSPQDFNTALPLVTAPNNLTYAECADIYRKLRDAADRGETP